MRCPSSSTVESRVTNVHTPQRLDGESFGDYKARRAQSKAIVKTVRRGPTQAPKQFGEISEARFWIGQHTNSRRNVERRFTAKFGSRQARKILRAPLPIAA